MERLAVYRDKWARFLGVQRLQWFKHVERKAGERQQMILLHRSTTLRVLEQQRLPLEIEIPPRGA